jgi:hypothetical protein
MQLYLCVPEMRPQIIGLLPELERHDLVHCRDKVSLPNWETGMRLKVLW